MKNPKTSHSSLHRKLRRTLAKTYPVIRGSLVVMNRFCGKNNCRCRRGYKHRSLYLSQSVKGKTTMKYIPGDREQSVREASERYQKIRAILNRLSEINIQKLILANR